ncbi:MAG: hypothetical protein LBT01_05920 [Spirochaetaceae bacterium]|jgi:hypothetical protein|nr:hypothetical protein [Spirochaetaceae bacterium]
MPILTDEEADALDAFSAEYLKARMLSTRKTPTELINGMIHREMTLVENDNA